MLDFRIHRGLQIQNVGGLMRTDIKTVQGVLHNCLEKLKPANEVKILSSSRTDAGVHAVCNALHFDLHHKYYPEKDFDAETIGIRVNQMLKTQREHIRLLKIQRVSDRFHSRHRAVNRQYIYRLCTVKDGYHDKMGFSTTEDGSKVNFHQLPVSPMENNSSYCVTYRIDMSKVLEAADTLTGLHNFAAFTNPRVLKDNDPVKNLIVGITRAPGILQHFQPKMADCFDFWDIHFQSPSFLYRQVRRMVGAMLKVGKGDMNMSELRRMLEGPEPHKDVLLKTHLQFSVPSYALFLKSVQYKDEDLEYDPSETNETERFRSFREQFCEEQSCKEQSCEEQSCKEQSCEEQSCEEQSCEEQSCEELSCEKS